MFASLSSRKSTAKSALFFALAAAFVLGTASCRQPTAETTTNTEYVYVLPVESTDSIVGTWIGTPYNDVYTFSSSEFTNGTSSDPTCGYAGTTPYICKISDASGIVYIKYTKAYDSNYKISGTAPDVGNWYAVYYSGLASSGSTTTVKISAAYKKNGATSESTLAKAVAEFTPDNGYFSSSSVCTKQ
jgi:hypothetical protein